MIAHKKGFTLIELLLVIGIVAILAAIVIVAVNPRRQLGDARDSERRSNVNQIEKAEFQYMIDYGDFAGDQNLPEGSTNALGICRMGKADAGCVNIDPLAPTYIACIPYDGVETNARFTGYEIYQEVGRPRVRARYRGSGSTASGCEEPPTPIAHWKFDESALGSIAADASGNGFDAIPSNFANPDGPDTSTPSVRFPDPYSLELDGSNDYLAVTTTNLLNVNSIFTIAAWIYIDTGTEGDDRDFLMRSNGGGSNEWAFTVEDSGLLALHIDGTKYYGGSPPLGEWIHVAAVRNGANAYLYQNGVETGTGNPGGKTISFGSCNTLHIGVDVDSGCTSSLGDRFPGKIDDLRIYNVALTGSQILSLAQGNP